MVTVAPGMAAPVESLTVPAMLPYTACAAAGTGHATTATTANRARRRPGVQNRRRAWRRAELIHPPCCIVPLGTWKEPTGIVKAGRVDRDTDTRWIPYGTARIVLPVGGAVKRFVTGFKSPTY